MTPQMIDTAVRLADVLARENAALAAMDLAGAASMLDEKSRAAEAFAAARSGAERAAGTGAPADLARQVAARLVSLAEENRRLLERGIAVQGGVLGCILRTAKPAGPQRYRASGAPAGDRANPVALSARA
ncbi:MAG: hypothetical protein JSR21_11820 [Proteobacteria bacterium]|nr:hypothetical protein [Pseudomonadota bacterium]